MNSSQTLNVGQYFAQDNSLNKSNDFLNNTQFTNHIDEYKSLHKTDMEDNWKPQKYEIENAIKFNEKLNEREIDTILLNLINRKRFSYNGKDILKYVTNCICCKKLAKIRHSQKYKNHFIFKKGEEKLVEELNVVNLLRMNRQVKLMT